MKAVTVARFGAPRVLELRAYPEPQPGPGEVRIQVAMAGLNFTDIAARQGLYPGHKPPFVPGHEVSGTVDALGPGVSGLAVGDRVVALIERGGYASAVVAPVAFVLKIPAGLGFAEAAAVPMNYLTAHHALFHLGTVHPGSTVLVHMAAGGVGTAVFQLLRTVPDLVTIGTASAGKHAYLRELGCTHQIDPYKQNYVEEVRKITGGRGVDVLLDPLGGNEWRRSYGLLAPAGRMVAYGVSSVVGPGKRSLLRIASKLSQIFLLSPASLIRDNRGISGLNLGTLLAEHAILRRQLERLLALQVEGVVRPHIYAEVPFSHAAEAHELLESHKNRGKVLLFPE